MVVCLTSIRFNMKADILRQSVETEVSPGQWILTSDPDSNEIIREWQSGTTDQGTLSDITDDLESFSCIARSVVGSGARIAGTTERFGELYEGVDYVLITFSSGVKISRRDRITNIRDAAGSIIWREEERVDDAPTVFNVNGVNPIISPFGKHIESMALLQRIEGQ